MIAFISLGGTELLIIFAVIFLLFGAKRVPELARSLGQAKREFTKGSEEVRSTIEKAKKDLD